MNKWMRILLVAVAATMLGACGTTAKKGGEAGDTGSVVEERGMPAAGPGEGPGMAPGEGPGMVPGAGPGMAPGAGPGMGAAEQVSPLPEKRGFEADALSDPSSILAKRIVYFDFDSSAIRDEDRAIVDAHAAYLAQHSDLKVTLEGHADERGSREYNVALGERRANTVRQALSVHGVASSQVSTVSYGEERPAANGHDETAWRMNRRVEIVYPAR